MNSVHPENNGNNLKMEEISAETETRPKEEEAAKTAKEVQLEQERPQVPKMAQASVAFDSKALNGLRGLAALHILFFHAFWYSTHRTNLFAQVHMPLFFLLSGFSLTLGYGRTKYKRTTLCCGPCAATEEATGCCACTRRRKSDSDTAEDEEAFDSWGFYYGRMTRILPVYYATWLFAIALTPLGHNHDSGNLRNAIWGGFASIYGVQTWVLVLGFGPDGPSWTVSTLFFFYLLFPRLLVTAQGWSNRSLSVCMVLSFWLQLTLGLTLNFTPVPFEAYWLTTASPFMRLPVFVMGVCAGVLCVRLQNGDQEALDSFGCKTDNCFLAFLQDNLFPIAPTCGNHAGGEIDLEVRQRSWRRRVDINMAFYFGTLILLSVFYTVVTFYGVGGLESSPLAWPSLFLQFTDCYLQLMITVGLCLDGGRSFTSRFFSTRLMQFLGRISMSLYLVHEPVIFYIDLCVYGPFLGPIPPEPWRRMPTWAIPIHIAVSLVLGTALTLLLEEPARKGLRKLKRPENESKFCVVGIVFLAMGALFAVLGGVFLADGKVLYENKVEIDGHTFHYQRIMGGVTMERAHQICADKGMVVFEPRDATVNSRVWEGSKGPYWLNVRRDNPKTTVFKYGTDGTEITWNNWNPWEPNNIGGYENCAAAANWGYFAGMWYDVNCDTEGIGVICQEKALEPAKDIEVTHNGKKYSIKPSRSGNFTEVKQLCEDSGQMLFEPREEAAWEAVYARARESGQTLIWLGIQQQEGGDSEKCVYVSDGAELAWPPDFKCPKTPAVHKLEGCVMSHSFERMWGVWGNFRCERNGQVICQDRN